MIGTTNGSKTCVATPSPSTALSTEIAGVIMPSPYSSAAPNRPIMTRIGCTIFPPFDRTSATSARMPPSPWLSARITNSRYLIDTVMISDQKISESDAEDVVRRDGDRHATPKKHSRRA